MDVVRAIEPLLTPEFPPVTVLEGARTSGKTFTARKLVDAGVWSAYESLADPVTLDLARHDPVGWLGGLPDATVIDEAQLLPELPLYVKHLVDERGSRRKFLLTGSARIGRSGLGGSDPLTGRVRRWTLAPLTTAELSGQPEALRSLISRMMSGEIASGREFPASDVSGVVQRGGFPLLATRPLSSGAADQWVRDTVLSLLTEHVLPDERFDTATALRVLDGCLRNPGGILNTASLAQRLVLDPRTIDRYLDVLERRFLLRFLPNLATNPHRQTRARSKMHPVDTAFAVESLRRSNAKVLGERETLGALLESHVVAQILAGLQFAATPSHAYYWRHAKTGAEVDLVVADSEGRRFGVEVKSSMTVQRDDARHLLAFAADFGLDAGYVVYPGTRVRRLADRCWALPASALAAADPIGPEECDACR